MEGAPGAVRRAEAEFEVRGEGFGVRGFEVAGHEVGEGCGMVESGAVAFVADAGGEGDAEGFGGGDGGGGGRLGADFLDEFQG